MAYYYDADGDFYNLSMSKDYSQMLADEAAKGVYASPTLLKQYEDYHNAKVDYLGYNNSIPKSYVYNDSPDGSIVHNYVPTGSETYDPNVDYSALIAQEAAKGTGANRAQLAQWEMQRNAKIAGQGLGYDPTYKFSSPAASSDDDSGSSGGSGGGGGYYGGGYGGYIGSTVSANPEDAFYALPQVVALQDQYDKAKERLATDAAIDNKNLNEWFNAQGLNTGTAGQMQLANRNVKAEAEAELERELATQLAQIANETGYAQLIAQYKAQQAAQAQQPQGGFVGGYYPFGGGYGGGGGSSGGGGGRGSSSSGSSSGSGNTSTSVAYDPSVDYQALINEELAKGSGADAALLKQLEQQRNAKIAGEGITDYNQTNYYQNGYTPSSGSGGGSGRNYVRTDRGQTIEDTIVDTLKNQYGYSDSQLADRRQQQQAASSVGDELNKLIKDKASNYEINQFLADAEAAGRINAAQRIQYTRYAELDGYAGTSRTPVLGNNAKILQNQLSSIPGLLQENKGAMIADAFNNGRITDYEMDYLLSRVGY